MKIAGELTASYWRVKQISQTTSTQDEIKSPQIRHGDVLVADYQSAGRGRLNRSFEAPHADSLLTSFYFEPEIARERWSWIPLLTGMSITRSINLVTKSELTQQKWPNDIMVGAKKLGGIIVEQYANGVIVGFGINITIPLEKLPVAHATSLNLEQDQPISREEVLVAVLNTFSDLYSQWVECGSEWLRAEVASKMQTIGKAVAAHLPSGEIIESIAQGLGENGELVLENGAVVSAGDIVHLR